MTSSPVSGSTTARGRARNVVSPSDSNAARPAAAVTMRAGGSTRAIAGSNSEGPTAAMVVVRAGLLAARSAFDFWLRDTRMGPCAPPRLPCSSPPRPSWPVRPARRRRPEPRRRPDSAGGSRLHRALQRPRPRRLDRRRRRLRGQGRRHRLQGGPGRHAVHQGPLSELRRPPRVQAAAGRQQRPRDPLPRIGRLRLRRHDRAAGPRRHRSDSTPTSIRARRTARPTAWSRRRADT